MRTLQKQDCSRIWQWGQLRVGIDMGTGRIRKLVSRLLSCLIAGLVAWGCQPPNSAQPTAAPDLASTPAMAGDSGQQAVNRVNTVPSDLDYEKHLQGLKQRLPDDEQFYIVVQKPFVVVGNGSEAEVRRWSTGTVRWAVEHLKQDFFSHDPDRIIDIWLFTDKASYEKYTTQLFGNRPHTPFGFYSSANSALVMNISTGGGTLVHEIVHPYIEANFPHCPSWFNEGLASLYEQSSAADGHIRGLTNWRLAGLQKAILDDSLPTLEQLCHTSTQEFYSDSGLNYAQARYLCFYLQQQGKLIEYYREFQKSVENDASGYATLVQVLGEPDMKEFETQWREFCLRLRFP